MSEIKCIVCKGKYFYKAYYEIDSNINIYGSDYHEIDSKSELELRITSENKKFHLPFDYSAEVYKYVCENCGFIMSFIKEKEVESNFQGKER